MKKRLCGLGTLCLLALAYALDTEGVFPCFIAAAIIHELGHTIAILTCGGRIRAFELAPFGFCLRFDALLSYRCDAIVAAGGAAMNLCAAFILSVAGKYAPDVQILMPAAGVNLMMGISNLLPALPLDGGRILYALLAQWTDDWRAAAITHVVSLLAGATVSALGVYILVKTRYNMSILAMGGLILGGTYAQRTGKNFTARS